MTATQPVDSIVARIREALEAGPTSGDWHTDTTTGAVQPFGVLGKRTGQNWRRIAKMGSPRAYRHEQLDAEDQANAKLVAACSPDAIRALLAHMDGLKKDAERYKAIKARHACSLVSRYELEPNGGYASHRAPAQIDAWADAAAEEVAKYDALSTEERQALFRAQIDAAMAEGADRG